MALSLPTVDVESIEKHPLYAAFNPKGRRFMRAVALPARQNPFLESHDISMYALIPFGVYPHVKALPAFQMMYDDLLAGRYRGKHTLVVPSSGNTAAGVIQLARAFGFKKVKVPMSNDVPASKTGVLRAFGDWVDVLQVGKPQEVTRELERLPGHYHLNQYAHPGNPRAHRLYTGPEIARVLDHPDAVDQGGLTIIAVALGSSGTALGIAEYFASRERDVRVIGVRPAPGEQVPGARNERAMAEVVELPWREKIRRVEDVSRRESFRRTRRLWSAVTPQPGPTSGMAWAGLEQYLRSSGPKELEELRGKKVAFLCPDDGRFYSDLVLAELDPDEGVE